jgi:hypothetical protein
MNHIAAAKKDSKGKAAVSSAQLSTGKDRAASVPGRI